MRINEIVTESLSRIAFHYASTSTALQILQSGQFKLSSAIGSVEEQYAPKGYPYFLSTTRTMTGGYHNTVHSGGGAMFVLDGNWFNNHYISRPIDYWENRDPTKSYGRSSEAEDRVYSKTNTIPLNGVRELHVMYDMSNYKPSLDADNLVRIKRLVLLAHEQGITPYLYNNESAWRRLNKAKSVDLSTLSDVADADSEQKPPYRSRRNYLEPWQELIKFGKKEDLSKAAQDILYNLNYTYRRKDAISGLKTDFSNYRKPSSGLYDEVVWIIAFMRKMRLHTIEDLVNYIVKKWENK